VSVILAPSILSADFGRLAEEVERVAEAGADWIHVDVMDGHFVPNLTMGPVIARAVRAATNLPVDVHLMIEHPDRYLEAFADAGASVLTVHQEACPHLHRTVERIRELGVRPGVAVNPATPLATLADIVPYIDLLLVMSVNPGFGGQSFIPTSYAKVGRARALLAGVGSGATLEVDGGVDAGNAAALVEAGATALVAGSAVYGHRDGAAVALRELRRAASRAGARLA
jgi:ribulose-phosphate 3-epimerase